MMEALESILASVTQGTDCEDGSTCGRDGGVSDQVLESSRREGGEMS